MKKIVIDLSFIFDNPNTGVSKYALRILEYIRDNNLQSSFILVFNVLNNNNLAKEYSDFESITIGKRWIEHTRFFKFYFYAFYFSRAIKRINPEVLFCPYGNTINCFVKTKTKITTIHDLQVRIDNSHYQKESLRQIDSENRMIKTSDFIFTISEFARKQILSYYPKIKDKLINMSNLVSLPLYKETIPMSPGFDYILYVGRLDPMKNISTLLKAYKRIHDKRLKYKLVLISHSIDNYNKLFKPFVVANKLDNEIILVHNCSETDLIRWYKGAKLFVFPSIREGFGFPPIEAGMLRVPVLSSKSDSLEEITKGLVNYYEDPLDDKELADKITYCLNTPMTTEQLNAISECFISNYSTNIVGKKICDFLFDNPKSILKR